MNAVLCLRNEACRGHFWQSDNFQMRGSDSMKNLVVIIKLVEALTNFIRALTDLIRIIKR